jgi:hypothetical protein
LSRTGDFAWAAHMAEQDDDCIFCRIGPGEIPADVVPPAGLQLTFFQELG